MADELRRQSDPRIDKLTADMDAGKRDIARIMHTLEGPQKYDARGNPKPGEGGMRQEVKEIKETVEGLKHQGNGGGGFSLRARDKAQITAFFAIVVFIVNVAREFV